MPLKVDKWKKPKNTVSAMSYWSVSLLSILHIFYVNIIRWEKKQKYITSHSEAVV